MKKIITMMVSIITSCILIALICLITLSQTILKKEYINNILEKNNYVDKVFVSMNKELKNYIPQLHIGEDDISLENIITKEDIKNDTENLLASIYNGSSLTTNTKEIKKRLDIKINAELNKYNRIPTKEEEKTIEEIKQNIIEEYKVRTIFSEKYIPLAHNYYQKINKIVNIATKVLSLLLTLSIISIIIINKKNKEYLKWISISLLTTTITMIIVKYLITNRISHILILNENISKILITVISNILNKIAIFSVMISIVSIIISIIKIEEKN